MGRWVAVFLLTLLVTAAFARALNTHIFSDAARLFLGTAYREKDNASFDGSHEAQQKVYDQNEKNRDHVDDQQEKLRDQMERMKDRLNRGRD